MAANVNEPDLVTPAEVRVALAHVLASPRFQACPRLTSFLRFVVETTLAGQAARLKGYTIGIEALGRADSFDPQIDPIVRVEASRLRRALDRYYAAEGACDPVVIELPRGRYVPRFRCVTHGGARVDWRRALGAIQRLLQVRVSIQVQPARIARDGLAAGKGLEAGKLAAAGPRLLPTAAFAGKPRADVRQDQQAEGAPAARPRRPRTG